MVKRKGLDKPEELLYNIEHTAGGYIPYREKLAEIQKLLDQCPLLIGFNIKFDLHWLRRYGVRIPDKASIWDTQIGHYILQSQLVLYPSLNEASTHYGLPQKVDNVKLNYWDKGIDTDLVPWQELADYLLQDLYVTEAVYKAQQKGMASESLSKKTRLVLACGEDLKILEEMEWNGLRLDITKCGQLSSKVADQISDIDNRLNDLIGSSVPLNYASNDHKSVLLYGGTIVHESKTAYIKKDGTASPNRHIISKTSYIFPRICQPPKGSELKKAGYYSTDEGTLKRIKAKGKGLKLIDLLLERTKLIRLNNTYYIGLPKLIEEMNWEAGMIHGSLNQCATVTGRLSSDKPNLQNNPEEIDRLFISQWD